jgi:hypothetical protein
MRFQYFLHRFRVQANTSRIVPAKLKINCLLIVLFLLTMAHKGSEGSYELASERTVYYEQKTDITGSAFWRSLYQ